jgi:uncharacterized protein
MNHNPNTPVGFALYPNYPAFLFDDAILINFTLPLGKHCKIKVIFYPPAKAMKTYIYNRGLFIKAVLVSMLLCIFTAVRSQEYNFSDLIDPETELLLAVYQQNLKKVQELLATGVSANAKDSNGTSALAFAISGDNEQIAWLLISEGANVNAVDFIGRNVIMHAIIEGKYKWVKDLLSLVEDINVQDAYGYTSLILAAESSGIKTAELLVLSGADVNLSSHAKTTALMHSAAFGDFTVTDFLLENGANPNYQAIDGSTALHLAAWYGHFEIAGLLIDLGADPDLQDLSGNTPLMVAVLNYQPEMVWYLLESGATPVAVNEDGFSAISIAGAKGSKKIIDLLLQYDIYEPAIQKKSQTVLGWAHYTRNSSMVNNLRTSQIRPKGLYFSELWVSQGFDFNNEDLMLFSGLSIYESRFRLLLTLSFMPRIGHRKLLVQQTENFIYQFHEKRNVWSLGMSKEQELFSFSNGLKTGINAGVDMRYSAAAYRGTGIKPPGGFAVSPVVALYAHYKQFTYMAAWNYFDTRQPMIPSHRYRVSIAYRILFFKRGSLNYKPVLN